MVHTLSYPFAPPKLTRKNTTSVKEILMGEHYSYLKR